MHVFMCARVFQASLYFLLVILFSYFCVLLLYLSSGGSWDFLMVWEELGYCMINEKA